MLELNERPAIAHTSLSVLLLARALSTETQEALQSWRHHLDALHRPYEIILLQECRPEVESVVAPSATTSSVTEPRKLIRTITYERSLGLRAAVNEAIRTAQHPLLVFCTCDLQFQPSDLGHLLRVIDQVDFVVGFRVGKPIPFWRLLLDTLTLIVSRIVLGVPLAPTVCWLGSQGWGRRWVARWVFGLRVSDPECPFRLGRRDQLQRLPLQARGSFLMMEMLAKANHLAALIAEEPVTWLPSELPTTEAISFAEDAWCVFRDPDFGPVPGSPTPRPPSAVSSLAEAIGSSESVAPQVQAGIRGKSPQED